MGARELWVENVKVDLIILTFEFLRTKRSLKVCVCVCACVRACVCACVRACVCACMHVCRYLGIQIENSFFIVLFLHARICEYSISDIAVSLLEVK